MIESNFPETEKQIKRFFNKVSKNLAKNKIDLILEAIAYKGHKYLVGMLPQKTGALKRSWFVVRKSHKEYMIASASKVALFLEEGTREHGPKTAKFLYIPLRPGARTWRKGFVLGKDYKLVKRVKGIDAMHYLKPVSEHTLKIMIEDFMAQLRKI